jgi:hypothetical protein
VRACACTSRHSPPAEPVLEVHHVVPRSWGGTDTSPASIGPGRNTVTVCPTTHFLVHAVLNLYVHAGGEPPRAVLARFPRYARRLAALGWDNRPDGHPTPFTAASA